MLGRGGSGGSASFAKLSQGDRGPRSGAKQHDVGRKDHEERCSCVVGGPWNNWCLEGCVCMRVVECLACH